MNWQQVTSVHGTISGISAKDGQVTVSRAAMNPCPCGYYGDLARECVCTPTQVQRYRSHISGPLLDRIDLHVDVPAG